MYRQNKRVTRNGRMEIVPYVLFPLYALFAENGYDKDQLLDFFNLVETPIRMSIFIFISVSYG